MFHLMHMEVFYPRSSQVSFFRNSDSYLVENWEAINGNLIVSCNSWRPKFKQEKGQGLTLQHRKLQGKPKSPSTATPATLVAGSADVKPACYFCGQPHYSNACSVVTSIEERRHIRRKNGRCCVPHKQPHYVKLLIQV